MKLPFTRRRKNQGIYGGFGSKAPEEVWRPSRHARGPTPDQPRKRRRLDIRRGRWKPEPLSETSMAVPGTILLALLALAVALFIAMLK